MKAFLFLDIFKTKYRYLVIIGLLLCAQKSNSQELFLLRYSGPGICLSSDCVIVESYYYLSGNTVISPIAEYNDFFVFDKFPTYLELVTTKEPGFNCDWRSPPTCGDRITLKKTDCNWVISNKVLAEPNVNTNSFCDKVTLAAVGCTGTQKFYWEYSTDGINFIKTNVNTSFNQNYDFVKANFPALNNYYGNIFFRVLIDWDPNTTEENIYSNIANYQINSCSPAVDGTPVASAVKCANESNGSVVVKLKETITGSQKLLLNLFEGNDFRKHKFVSASEIVNKQFIWDGIAAGTYTIKYQAQNVNDSTDRIGAMPVVTDAFTIKNITPLSFKISSLPICPNDSPAINIEVQGGTAPYYYTLDNESEIVNGVSVEKRHEFTSPYIITPLTEGQHFVKVSDSNKCIEKKI